MKVQCGECPWQLRASGAGSLTQPHPVTLCDLGKPLNLSEPPVPQLETPHSSGWGERGSSCQGAGVGVTGTCLGSQPVSLGQLSGSGSDHAQHRACVQGELPAGCPARRLSGAPGPSCSHQPSATRAASPRLQLLLEGPLAPPQPGGPQDWPECWAPPFLGSGACQAEGLNLSFPPRNSEGGVAPVCPAGEAALGPASHLPAGPCPPRGGRPVWGRAGPGASGRDGV